MTKPDYVAITTREGAMMRLYKILGDNGRPYHGGSGAWPLPTGDGPGEWLEVEGELVPCRNGLHLCRAGDVPFWAGPRLYEAEHDGELVEHGSDSARDSKVVVRRARLTREVPDWDRIARLFAADRRGMWRGLRRGVRRGMRWGLRCGLPNTAGKPPASRCTSTAWTRCLRWSRRRGRWRRPMRHDYAKPNPTRSCPPRG